MMQKKVAFKTLGCRLNQYETDALATQFTEGNYKIVDFNDEADVYIINTCTVTNQSDHKSRNIISQAGRKGEKPLVVVTGCMANAQREALENRSDISYVVQNEQKSSVFSLIEAHYRGEIIQPGEFANDKFNFSIADKGFHTRSHIKIQDGCDNFCTFCIIPRVRGRAISRPVDDVLENVRKVVDAGAKELVITGVNIGRYDFEGTNFESLLEQILNMPGDFRVRISSIEPDGFGERFFELVNHPRLCPHLHLCLQSGSDKVLLQMRRMYDISIFRNIVNSIRKNRPDFNFTTDVIVGFPGETEAEFQQTMDFIREMKFSHVHTFKYSVRQGTRAARMPGQIPEKIKTSRSERVRDLVEEMKQSYRELFIGTQQRVLIEKIRKSDGYAQGYSEHFVPVRIKMNGKTLEKNMFVDAVPEKLIIEKEPVLIG